MIFDETVLIRRPPEAVFKRLSDIQEGEVQPGFPVLAMEKIPPGSTVVGTRWREVVRLTKRRSMTMWSEVTGIEPDSMLPNGSGAAACGAFSSTPSARIRADRGCASRRG
jgi:hypothetical protein